MPTSDTSLANFLSMHAANDGNRDFIPYVSPWMLDCSFRYSNLFVADDRDLTFAKDLKPLDYATCTNVPSLDVDGFHPSINDSHGRFFRALVKMVLSDKTVKYLKNIDFVLKMSEKSLSTNLPFDIYIGFKKAIPRVKRLTLKFFVRFKVLYFFNRLRSHCLLGKFC